LVKIALKKVGRRCCRFRGFVGPLGDDIPSIFPIVAGIMLFFGTIAFAGNLAAQKNSYLEVRKAAVSLSYVMTEKGFIDSASWTPKCDALKKAADANNVFVLATLKRFCGQVDFPDPGDPPQLSPYYAADADGGQLGHTWRECTNDEKIAPMPTLFNPSRKAYAVIFNFPVAVPCPNEGDPTFGPGILNIIVWRR
jgi:hypothetical protein